ncbi:unnamed protein product [Linum trigynum]|uniref:Uncharacterized protein n=1 Tax=Linum trigynum TaxID=586398 RepID=A0AAV2ERI5_9ROSI
MDLLIMHMTLLVRRHDLLRLSIFWIMRRHGLLIRGHGLLSHVCGPSRDFSVMSVALLVTQHGPLILSIFSCVHALLVKWHGRLILYPCPFS